MTYITGNVVILYELLQCSGLSLPNKKAAIQPAWIKQHTATESRGGCQGQRGCTFQRSEAQSPALRNDQERPASLKTQKQKQSITTGIVTNYKYDFFYN